VVVLSVGRVVGIVAGVAVADHPVKPVVAAGGARLEVVSAAAVGTG